MIKRIKSNKASATTIIGIFTVVVLLLIGVFIVDLSRLVMMKNTYTLMAQNAVVSGIKQQDPYGYLKLEAANDVVESYAKARQNPQVAANRANCDNSHLYPIIHVSFEKERGFGEQNGNRKMTSYRGELFNNHVSLQTSFYKNKYKAMSIEVEDVVDGVWGGIIGQGCHKMTVRAGSINSTLFDEDR